MSEPTRNTNILHLFNTYQDQARATASYPDLGSNLIYPALGIAGESGEIVDKIKKLYRNHGITRGDQLTPEQKLELVKEIGDELWYLANLCCELDVDLSYAARINIEKLTDRVKRGVVKSEGDNR